MALLEEFRTRAQPLFRSCGSRIQGDKTSDCVAFDVQVCDDDAHGAAGGNRRAGEIREAIAFVALLLAGWEVMRWPLATAPRELRQHELLIQT